MTGVTTLLLLSGVARSQNGHQDTPSRAEIADAARGTRGASYIPLDSWIYPAAIRFYELGYLPTAYIGMRPWTRASLAHMLQLSQPAMLSESTDSEALAIFNALHRELAPELSSDTPAALAVDSIYTRVRGIHGTILNDSYHLGQTVINDYGRPYQPGWNHLTGYSLHGTAGRFDLFVRGEYQHAPAANGYSAAVANVLADLDRTPHVPQFGIPQGSIPQQNNVRLLEADLSAHLLGHQISFGKDDAWLGPAQGSSMAWSNNAENIYSFRINRIEPLFVPGLSSLVGVFRYDFFVGSLKGHNYPNDPWIHSSKISFKPTPDLEFGFQRSVIWGGKGHVPITVHTFLRSFFSLTAVSPAQKFSRDDPGARFSTFDFTWRVPWQNHLLTVYTDSLVHDNVFPVSNPGRAGLRPGIYLSRLPGMPHADLRIEGVTTSPRDPGSTRGQFLYFESAQNQGYTNRGQIIGDWIGREATGGQGWFTWHLKPDQSIQLEYRMAKAAADFIPGGTTQQNAALHVLLRPTPNLELKASAQGELWRAPLVAQGTQHNFTGTFQLTYFPHLVLRR
ncbi:MAG TPA: capsule assembly Wzi family protein [Acidobacteriaceae bacterium]|nr:capsule assembly Wzi family protein [Acidobacteriaceae bacterium]